MQQTQKSLFALNTSAFLNHKVNQKLQRLQYAPCKLMTDTYDHV